MSQLSEKERETLKSVYRLSQAGEVRGGDLAAALELSPATVTARIKHLTERGLVEHLPYQSVELTDKGRRAAVSAIRRHRIVERFLSDMLGYPWEEADRLAVTFEHRLPDEVEHRLFVALDRPTTCPHGFPIPDPDSDHLPVLPPLASLEPGEEAVVAVPGSTDPEVVAFLETLDLRPGVRVTVREKHPFEGPVVLSVNGQDRTIGHKLARQIFVRETP
ncbi:MAG: DtxR family transcriptional regulator [Acidimicrobiia bacterium]